MRLTLIVLAALLAPSMPIAALADPVAGNLGLVTLSPKTLPGQTTSGHNLALTGSYPTATNGAQNLDLGGTQPEVIAKYPDSGLTPEDDVSIQPLPKYPTLLMLLANFGLAGFVAMRRMSRGV